ncbi:MAG: hypothetical protein JKY48_06640 [Flavobacteriales bacterium]|nr:hypothetical protein [Flavobacteriales bacterium]
MKTLFSISLFFISLGLMAQYQLGRLTVYGKVKHKTGIVGNVNLEVYKDNELSKELVNYKNGSFKLELPLGSIYSITFKKEGYIEKSVAVIAKTDSLNRVNGRFFFQLDIELFKSEENSVDESILPPVAKLYIKNQNSGFKYDKKYVKWVAEEYEEELTD